MGDSNEGMNGQRIGLKMPLRFESLIRKFDLNLVELQYPWILRSIYYSNSSIYIKQLLV